MDDFETMLVMLFVYAQGITVGYIICDLRAPKTPFKKGFVDGLSLKSLWSRK